MLNKSKCHFVAARVRAFASTSTVIVRFEIEWKFENIHIYVTTHTNQNNFTVEKIENVLKPVLIMPFEKYLFICS